MGILALTVALHLLLNFFRPLPCLMIFRVILHPNTRFHQIQPHTLVLEIAYHQLQQTHNRPVLSIPQLLSPSGVIAATVLFSSDMNSSK